MSEKYYTFLGRLLFAAKKSKLTQGSVSVLGRDLPKLVVLGVSGVVLLYVSVAGIVSFSVPWANKSDTKYHIDYVWQLYNGKLPKFEDGVQYPPLKNGAKMHLTASHPPLFYALHAPILGPLLKDGQWKKAIAVGRSINIVFGVLCVLALAWAGWVFGGGYRDVMTVAVPAVGTLMYRFTTLNVVFGNDVLVVLFATIAIVLMYKLLQRGLQKKYLIVLGVVSVLGMATKAPYVVVLAVSLLAIVFGAILHHPPSQLRRSIIKGLGVSFLLTFVSVLAVGWFYYLNYKSSGSWFKSSPDDFAGGRVYKSLSKVITSSQLWELFYTHSSTIPYVSTAITAISAAGFLIVPKKKIVSLYTKNKPLFIMILLMILLTFGILLTQIRLAVGYGSINFRYLLPALLPISLFLVYGLIQFKAVRGQFIALCAVVMGASTLLPVAASSSVAKLVPGVSSTSSDIEKIFVATSSNGIPAIVTVLLLMCFAVGAWLLIVALFKLSRPELLKG
jgi:4-amino-4-deoxy-L-arabinose transferase-like glycosyltransferase